MTDERAHPPTSPPPEGETEAPEQVAAPAQAAPIMPPRPPALRAVSVPAMPGMGGVRGGKEPPPAPGTVSPTGSGQDVRHRGWYWHWNTLVTQYAPLLGLKGVGLLNSYTVWTDRREGSPHHGYAFPAQESQSNFYGEGREELITLNKVLVALDLIEIHKEMVLRQDERGRRWRVPHNFYRVKDPKDGLVLSLPAVLRVLELARRDRNIYRHIRHIFGPQFAPIDRTSLWHLLLPELRELPLWQELAAQAARERRTPRKVAHPDEAATGSSDAMFPDAAPLIADHTTVSEGDTAPPTTRRTADEARTFSTFLSQTTARATYRGDLTPDNAPLTDADFPRRTYAVPPVDAETVAFASAAPDVRMDDAEEHTTDDEGMVAIEEDRQTIVRPGDRMQYRTRESREEGTRTSSTRNNTRAREDERATEREDRAQEPPRPERGRRPPLPPHDAGVFHSTAPQTPERDVSQGVTPPRPTAPAVSDLFAAMADRSRQTQAEAESWYARANLPRAVEVWEQIVDNPPPLPSPPPPSPLPAVPPALTEAAFDPADLPDPDAMPGQPLPPVPGEENAADAEPGTIIVRTVAAHNDESPLDAAWTAQLAEIEAALTMANGKPPSEMQLSLLWQAAQECDAAARTQPGPGSGLGWVLAAIWEAVNSGSDFVAPKRVAAICERWAAEGFMSNGRTAPAAAPAAPRAPHPPPAWFPVRAAQPVSEQEPDAVPESGPFTPLPTQGEGHLSSESTPLAPEEGARLWAGVLRRLDGVLHPDALQSRGFVTARVIAVGGDRAVVQAPDAESAAKLGTYRGLIARRLADVLGRPVADVAFVAASSEPQATSDERDEGGQKTTPSPWAWPASANAAPLPAELAPRPVQGSGPLPLVLPVAPSPRVVSREAPLERDIAPVVPPIVPTFTVPGTGLTNGQLWERALHGLRGQVSAATFKVWLESAELIAVDDSDTFVIGTRNRVQRERLERQHTGEIAAALADVLGRQVAVRVVVIGDPGAMR